MEMRLLGRERYQATQLFLQNRKRICIFSWPIHMLINIYIHLICRTSTQPLRTWATEYLCHERRPRHIWNVEQISNAFLELGTMTIEGSPDCAPGSKWAFLDQLKVGECDAEDDGEQDHGPAVPRLNNNNNYYRQVKL